MLSLVPVAAEIRLARVTGPTPFILKEYDTAIPAGFPSPAADYMMEEIDLAKVLIPRPLSTFIVKVTGDSMVNNFIPSGARLVVDRSLKPKNHSIIVGVINGEFTVKRFFKDKSKLLLLPGNPSYRPITITEEMGFVVWGVVTQILIDPEKLNLT